jgi:hypothetical protein
MPQARGSKGRIFYAEESSWGVLPGSPVVRQLKAITYGESLGATGEELRSGAITGARALESVRMGPIDAGGSLPFEAAPLGIGTLMKHAIGGRVTTGTGPYTHVIKRGILPAGLTIEKNFEDVGRTFRFAGCKIDRLQMSFAPTGLVTGTMDVVAKNAVVPGTAFTPPTPPVHDPFASVDVSTFIGGVATCMLGFSFDLSNNLSRQRCIGDRFIDELPEGQGALNGQITVKFTDTDSYYTQWLAENDFAIRLLMTRGSASHELLLPKVRLSGDAIPKLANAEGVTTQLNWAALYDTTEQTDIKYTIINTEATV